MFDMGASAVVACDVGSVSYTISSSDNSHALSSWMIILLEISEIRSLAGG